MAVAMKRSAGSNVTSVGGAVTLLGAGGLAGVPDPTLGIWHKELTKQ